jgi:PAS domain S-box-containing protein
MSQASGDEVDSRMQARAVPDDRARLPEMKAAPPPEAEEKQFRVLFEMNPLPLWVYDFETLAVLEVNEAVVRHYGYSREECLSLTLNDIRPAEDVPRLQAYFREHLPSYEPGRTTFAGTWRHRKKDGTLIDVEITSSVINFRGCRAGLGVVKDITEQTRALDAIRQSEEAKARLVEALQASESLFRSITENAPDYIFQIDSNSRILFANRVVPQLQIKEVLGTRLQDWVGKEYHALMNEVIARAFNTGEPQSYEVPSIGADTRPAWYRSRIGPVLVAGKVVSAIVIAHDVTEFKRHEEQLRDYAGRLQALSRRLLEVQEQERRHLARELHDEIGQLLTGLKLSLELSARDGDGMPESHLEEARRLVRELTAQVRDLSLHLRPTMLDDLGLLPALLWHLQRYTAQTGIRVAFEHQGLDRRLPPELETGVYRIVQEALTNVARHARVDETRLRVWIDDHVLGLCIEDEGQGFDPQGVLSPRVSSGLSGMQERAVLLGGQLQVNSGAGSGTRLLAEFPIQSKEHHNHHAHDHRTRR